MLGISGFKTGKPRQFSYKPLYYDPEQEERDLRNALREEKNSKEYKPGSLVKGMRMERYGGSDVNSKRMEKEARTRVMIRLCIGLILLFIVGYVIMNSTLLDSMFTVFGRR